MAKNEGQTYSICQQCNGNGVINGKECPKCAGHGVELLLGDSSFYWGKKMSPFAIMQRRLHLFIDNTINFFLLFLAILGLLSFGYYIFLFKNIDKIIKDFVFPEPNSKTNYLLLAFWCAILIFMYLMYRMEREIAKGKIVKFKTTLTQEMGENILKNKGGGKEDISSAFTNDAARFIEKIYNLSNARRRAANNTRKKTIAAAHEKDTQQYLIITPFDILMSLLFFDKINVIFFRLGIDYGKLRTEMELKSKKIDWNYACGEYFLKKILLDAYLNSYEEKQKKVDLTNILISLIKNDSLYPTKYKDGVINEILYELELDLNKVINVVKWSKINEKIRENWQHMRHQSFFKPKGEMDRAMTAIATPILDQYSQDMTALAKRGYLAPCIGRENEISNILRIFESGKKGVLLTGNPGVGKNTIVEGIAQMMATEEVPESWQDKRLLSLSIARLVSGANPQQAMDRLLQAFTEAARSRNIILFIDNIEGLIGISAGREGSIELSEVLVSSMLKYGLRVIATTTPPDYTRYVEPSALIEAFQKISIDEPEDNNAIQILEAKTAQIEAKNQIYFSYTALEKTLYFSKRFIHDRFLPEKAINIIEEAGIFVKKKKGKNSIVVTEDIAELISEKIKVPLSNLEEDESKKLIDLEDRIHKRVINQAEAVKAVADALRRARVEFRDIRRPIANMLFLGPTGVGKTELAKTVSEVYFGREDDMIRLDMSEYQNKDSLDRLIGAPDNYEVTGILTEAARKHPFALLLLDEIEKAHPDILNLFLQVMDDGRLTDNRGRIIDFTNTIIIATSNAGTGFIQDEIKKETPIEEIEKSLMNRELKMFFRPEFLNRFDGLIVFKPLTMENVRDIAMLMLSASAKRMDEKGIKLEFTDKAIDWISLLGYDPIFGARPLRRAIQENIDTLLAKYLIEGKVERGDRVIIGDGGLIKIIHN
ncbi:MAG: AAA family ATPase [bacterium]